MSQSSISQLYFESLRLSKAPIGWIFCSIAVHLGLFCFLSYTHGPVYQQIAFRPGNGGVEVELIPDSSSAVASSEIEPKVETSAPQHTTVLEPVPAKPEGEFPQAVSSSKNNSHPKKMASASLSKHAQETGQGVSLGSKVAQPAAQIFTPQPPYPSAARELGLEAKVKLRVCVGADGGVRTVEVADSSGRYDFDSSSLTTVKRQWRFRPARSTAGAPIESTIPVTIRFILRS